MLKIVKSFLIQSVLGIVLFALGIQTIYMYVMSLNENSNIFLFFLSFILMGTGLFLLMRAGKKSDVSVFKRLKNFKNKQTSIEKSLEQSLQKNEQLTNTYANTVEKRDKLKMLEISTAANAEAEAKTS